MAGHWPDHIKAPPKSTPCVDCGYPRYDLDGVCPGCETNLDGGRISSNVRVIGPKQDPVPVAPILTIKEACDTLAKSAQAFSNGDKSMRESMVMALYRASEAVQRLIIAKDGEPE